MRASTTSLYTYIRLSQKGVSPLRRGLFVLWGGWGERKRERAGHDVRLLLFYRDTQREPLRRREERSLH